MARSECLRRRAFTSSNFSVSASSRQKACESFVCVTASSTSAVCSARVCACRANMPCVRRAMNAATTSDTGVSSTTTSVIVTLWLSMKHSVPTMVRIPENSSVKPSSRPSDSRSASEMTRLTTSPYGRLSSVLSGRRSSLRNASSRRSRITSAVMEVHSELMPHCVIAPTTAAAAMRSSTFFSAAKFTAPAATMASTACPVSTGIYSDAATDSAASTSAAEAADAPEHAVQGLLPVRFFHACAPPFGFSSGNWE